MQVWVNTDEEKNVGAMAEALEKAVKENGRRRLVAFIVFINPKAEAEASLAKRLEGLAADKKIENVALAYVSGPRDSAVEDYRINTDERIKNTVFVYKNKTVDSKFVNFVADKKGVESLNAAIQNVLR